jgi:endo-1,3(4)-beta-glucanase
MSIMHVDDSQKVFGASSPSSAPGSASFFINPGGIQSIILSEITLGKFTTISMDSLTDTSINVRFLPSTGAAPVITFPLVQGMGFVTAQYSGGTPIVQSGVFFRTVTKASNNPKPGVTKYTILLEDGKTWLLYASSPIGQAIDFTVVSNGLLQATSGFTGIIQISKSPGSASESLYDSACGAYATTTTISGSIDGDQGYYKFKFTKAGLADTALVMFALPHHLASFATETAPHVVTGVQLATTTKGQATAVWADSWTLQEALPLTMGFAPWKPSYGNAETQLSAATIAFINNIAVSEVSQNMGQQTNLNSMYFSGKVSKSCPEKMS